MTCSTSKALINGDTYWVPDSAISASSSYGRNADVHHSPLTGQTAGLQRYRYLGEGEWLQMDLGALYLINSVATQGYNSGRYDNALVDN